MRIVVCDDDKIYANEIKYNVISILRDYNVSPDCSLFFESKEIFKQADSFDMAFLDIKIKPYTGIETAKKLKEINPNIIVFFITSYDGYLDDAMDIGAFRYISKPLDVERLKSGIAKALELIDNRVINFLLKDGKNKAKVLSSDIIYLETVRSGTKIVTARDEYLSNQNIDYFEQKLIPAFFCRIHKSFIINMRCITHYARDTVTLSDKYNIAISRKYQTDFRQVYLNYFGGR